MSDKRVLGVAFLIFFILWSNNIKLNDEYLIIEQLKSITHLRFDITIGGFFSYQGTPYFTFKNLNYASFSHSVAIVSLPIYFTFEFISNFFHFIYFLNWLFISAVVISFRNELPKKPAWFSTLILILFLNLIAYKPLFNYQDWIPLYSIHFTNIILAVFTAFIFFRLLVDLYSSPETSKICSLLLLFATPIAYWTLTAKHHSLSIFIISLILFLVNRYEKEMNVKKLYLSFLMAGFLIWIRPLDGVTLFVSLFLYSLYKAYSYNGFRAILIKFPIYISFSLIGYLPGFAIGMYLFNNPLPIEIFGNLIAGSGYVRFSSLNEIVFEFPYIFIGINGKTLGVLSYSPVFGLLFSNLLQRVWKKTISIRRTYLNLKGFEKFILLFSVILFLVYLPTIKSGVINTDVHDYRFYLPLMIPMTLFLSKTLEKYSLDFSSFLRYFSLNFAILFTTIILCVTLTKNSLYPYFNNLYLISSSILFILFITFDRFSEETKTALLSLSIMPTSIIVLEGVVGYYGPYDSHFVISIIDYIIKKLIAFFGWV
jgi:hypothetical protein